MQLYANIIFCGLFLFFSEVFHQDVQSEYGIKKKNPLQPLNWIDSYKLQGFDIDSF